VGRSAPSASRLSCRKPCGAVDTLEGRDGIQRDGQAAEVGLREPHEVQQGQVQAPARGSGQRQTQIQAGQIESSPEKKDLRVLVA